MNTTKNRRTIKTLATAGTLALLLGACGGGDDFDEETATQAGYDHAQEVTATFGINEAAELCDTYAAGDEEAWREHVTATLEGMDDFRHTWGDEMFRGVWDGLLDYCQELGGY